MPGIVEHGLFIGMASVVLVANGSEIVELRANSGEESLGMPRTAAEEERTAVAKAEPSGTAATHALRQHSPSRRHTCATACKRPWTSLCFVPEFRIQCQDAR